MRAGKETTSISPISYSSEEDKIREKIIRIREKKEKRKAEKQFIRIQKEGMTETKEAVLRVENEKREKQYTRMRRSRRRKQQMKLLCHSPPFPFPPPSPSPSPSYSSIFLPSLTLLCSSPPYPSFSLPLVSLCSSPPSLLLHDQEWMVLSKNCPKIRQKQDLDAKIATTSKQKLPTQSDDAGLEKFDGKQTRSVSQISPNNYSCKQTISISLTTTMLFGEKTKPCLTTAKSNPAVHNERKKSDSVTETKIDKANLM